ncbi:MAG: hypothetical protein ABMA13_08515 [Chthoniobacteraceae bacterium]
MSRALWLWLLLPAASFAHNPDTSYARCIIADNRVELRLTYDVFTLQMITTVDGDGDQRVTPAELRRAAPAIERFLREHVNVEIDGNAAPLGDAAAPIWPGGADEGLAAPDWHTAAGLITFPFRQSRTPAAREVGLSFALFQTLTPRHTVLGSFEHGAQKEEVSFTQAEPDFLFDATYVATAPPAPVAPAPVPKFPRYAWLIAIGLLPLLWWRQRCSGKSRS